MPPHSPTPHPLALPLLLLTIALPAPARAADADPPPPLARLAGPSGTAVAFSRDGSRILTAGKDEARVWDGRTFQPVTGPIRQGDGSDLVAVALSTDGKLVLTVTEHKVRVFGADRGKELWTRAWPGLQTAALSPDGRRVVVGSLEGSATILDALTGQHDLDLGEKWVRRAAFSPDGGRVITIREGGVFENDRFLNLLVVWDAATGRRLAQRLMDDADPRPVGQVAAFSPDSRWLATPRSGKVEVATTANNDEAVVAGPSARTLSYSPDGQRLATTDGAGFVALRDATTGKLLKELDYSNWAEQALFSPDGRRLLTPFREFGAAVYDLASGRRVLSVPGRAGQDWSQPADAPAAAWSPDGQRVAVGFAGDGYTGIYEVPSGGGK